MRDAIELHLRHKPLRTSKNGIKRLRGMSRSQFRPREAEVRVFDDVVGKTAQVLAVVPKSGIDAGLAEVGEKV